MFSIKKESLRKLRSIRFIIVVGIIVVLDQYTKYIVSIKVPKYNCVNLIPNVLNVVHIYNPGGAFGFMSHGSTNIRNFLFLGISNIAVIAIIYFYKNLPNNAYNFFAFGLLLIIGGAIGNIIDRLRLGGVVDFLDFFIFSYHWPAFNLADIAITFGIIIIVSHVLLNKIPN